MWAVIQEHVQIILRIFYVDSNSKQHKLLVTMQGFFLYSFYAFHVSEKLSFWVFGTEFSENLVFFGQNRQNINF